MHLLCNLGLNCKSLSTLKANTGFENDSVCSILSQNVLSLASKRYNQTLYLFSVEVLMFIDVVSFIYRYSVLPMICSVMRWGRIDSVDGSEFSPIEFFMLFSGICCGFVTCWDRTWSQIKLYVESSGINNDLLYSLESFSFIEFFVE